MLKKGIDNIVDAFLFTIPLTGQILVERETVMPHLLHLTPAERKCYEPFRPHAHKRTAESVTLVRRKTLGMRGTYCGVLGFLSHIQSCAGLSQKTAKDFISLRQEPMEVTGKVEEEHVPCGRTCPRFNVNSRWATVSTSMAPPARWTTILPPKRR